MMTARKFTSLSLMLAFALLILTSLVLYVVPEGRVAYWSNWRWLGLSKTQWSAIHTNSGFLFLFAGLIHLLLNWKPTLAYLSNRAKQIRIFTPAFLFAIVLNTAFVAGTLLDIPPFSSILQFGHSFKDAAADFYGEPPYGHAELSSLRLFAKRTGLNLDSMKSNLAKANIKFTSDEQTLLEIAQANNLTPKAVFDAMQGQPSDAPKALPAQPMPGLGRLSLADLCQRYSLDQTQILSILKTKNITAAPNQTLKEIGDANATDPRELYDLIYESLNANAN